MREIRNATGLSQEEFGRRIGMTRSEVKNIEYNVTTLKDLTIPLVCKTYHVNEKWLRSGEGEMLRDTSTDDEITRILGGIIKEDDSFRKRVITVLARMTPDEWELLERKAREILEEP